MIGYYKRNLIRFITKLTKYNIINNKEYYLEILLSIIITYETILSLYNKGHIEKEEFDNYIDNINNTIWKFIRGIRFRKNFIVKGKIPLVVSKNHDILKKEGLLIYDEKNNLYYIDLKQIMYNINSIDYDEDLEK